MRPGSELRPALQLVREPDLLPSRQRWPNILQSSQHALQPRDPDLIERWHHGGSTSGGSTGTSGGFGTSGGTGGATGDAGPEDSWVFTWTFGVSGTSCERAGASWIEIQLNGSTIGLFPCRDPFGNEGVTIPASPLSQDTYTLVAYNSGGNLSLAQGTGMTPFVQGPTGVAVNMTFNTGGPSNLDLTWTFEGQTCLQAGVTQVQVVLKDPDQPALDVSESVACSSAGLEGITLQGYGNGQFPLTLSANGSDARISGERQRVGQRVERQPRRGRPPA